MALLGDLELLRRHINNVFITNDDTLISEMVLDDDSNMETDKKRWGKRLSTIRHRDAPYNPKMSSYAMSVGVEDTTTHRNNKAKPSNKMQTERIAVDTSKVEANPDIDYLFTPIPLEGPPQGTRSNRSTSFSRLVEKTQHYRNPFVEYCRFDASADVTPTVKLRIFLTMCGPDAYIDVTVSPKATVEQAIGLVLFQYVTESREPYLSGSVHDYCFRHRRIDEDDIMLFQPLASRDLIKKYYSFHNGYGALELELWRESRQDTTLIKVYYDNQFSTTVNIQGTKVKMENIFLPALRKKLPRRQSQSLASVRDSYVLEKLHEPGVIIPLDSFFEDMNTTEFKLVRLYSKRTSSTERDGPDVITGYSRFQSLQYEVFSVQVQERILKRRIDVQLGISEEKIEIDFLMKSSLPPFKRKAESINTQNLIRCEILPDKNMNSPGTRKRLKMTYLTEHGDAKEFLFESESEADQINRKVLFIISQLQSTIRQSYLLSMPGSSGTNSSGNSTRKTSSIFSLSSS